MLVGDLRAEAIDLIVTAGDAHQLSSVNLGAEHLGRLKIGRNKDPGLEPFSRSLSGHGIGQIAGRGAGDRIESKAAGLGKRDRDYPVLEAQSRQADRVVLDREPLCAQFFRQMRRADQRRKSGRQ